VDCSRVINIKNDSAEKRNAKELLCTVNDMQMVGCYKCYGAYEQLVTSVLFDL
jgi:hypothetical protein